MIAAVVAAFAERDARWQARIQELEEEVARLKEELSRLQTALTTRKVSEGKKRCPTCGSPKFSLGSCNDAFHYLSDVRCRNDPSVIQKATEEEQP